MAFLNLYEWPVAEAGGFYDHGLPNYRISVRSGIMMNRRSCHASANDGSAAPIEATPSPSSIDRSAGSVPFMRPEF